MVTPASATNTWIGHGDAGKTGSGRFFTVSADGGQSTRFCPGFAPHEDAAPVAVFDPADLRAVKSGPAWRRSFRGLDVED